MATDAQLMAGRSKFLKNGTTVGITCVPFSGGQPKGGVDDGPVEMVRFGILDQVQGMGYAVELSEGMDKYRTMQPAHDPPLGRLKNARYVGMAARRVRDQVQAHCQAGRMAVTLGGDHSIAMGTLAGSAAVYGDDMCVVWVDAHADINTPATSDSGNLHGCPLAYVLGLCAAEDVAADSPFAWIKPCIRAQRLVYIGLRDVDAGEKVLLREHGIRAFSMHDVDKHGIGRVVEMALDHVNPGRTRPIHMSFDVDALDPSVAPATGTPVRGGLTFREGHYICEAVAETGCLVALDLVEVNPALGDPESLRQTVAVGCSLVRCSLGESLL
ncbi:Arginase, catabolizes arginine to ornithine and urea [Coemansia sp. RSA 2706]|nr:Arginase, catabolizes arginine to ornithine and urea [Coemansia sp. RSA 2711]KAJ2285538.1 Arginase, catabolizes arginine to ornithine and urea [Coemansia sp. RSA 2706]KAJ2308068.1 Arginase, catabolizes arginine to ornithine and urea [Coemansia sp. RSA 2705]KAJ2310651.1 Arginase, catabolizes arginine to ornithine and urea [Coemansia sp. RSA 2702]KAJ2313944.1 Arginase, catabolizes arginine to ornithine and urea [Coemansia sp. RSA 2704]KAJ2366314.1 Arginase, catabolizes arginine to ornithine a